MPIIDVSGTSTREAGTIDITLSDYFDSEKTIEITGTHHQSLDYQDQLNLLAIGRHGIDGKIGRNGQAGQRGRNGTHAHEGYPAGNGGAGTNGEDGELGSDGGPGGPGGTIHIRVDQNDLALLSSIQSMNVSAGIPGHAGKHGKGGEGGSGGRGGNGYSWTTPQTLRKKIFATDANGHSTQTFEDEIRYKTSTLRAGCNGASGHNGKTSTKPLYPGRSASPGQIKICITSNGKAIQTHDKPFQLSIERALFTTTETNELFEPSDTLSIRYQASNLAPSMSTPPEAIPLLLENNDQLELIQHGQVSGNIPAGSTKISETPLLFKIIPPFSHDLSTPYQQQISFVVTAQNMRLNRPFTGVSSEENISIGYPVELVPQTAYFAITREEVQVLKTTIKNISEKDIGHEVGRELQVEIVPEMMPRNPALSTRIPLLKSQATYTFEKRVGFDLEAKFGSTQQFQANLYLQPIDRSLPLTLIQRQTFSVQLTAKYSPAQNGFLLVINNETSPLALNYWINGLNQLAGKEGIAIWNTDYYNQFILDAPVKTSTLLADTAHGSIVILDNHYGVKSGLRKNSQFITESQVFKAHHDHNVSLFVVGAHQKRPEARLSAVELDERTHLIVHRSVNEFIKYLLKPLNPLRFDAKNTEHTILMHCVKMPFKASFFSPLRTNTQLVRVLEQTLVKTFPNRHYHVGMTETEASSEHATLMVYQIGSPLERKVKEIEVDEQCLENPTAIPVLSLIQPLIDSMHFSQALQLFNQGNNTYLIDLKNKLANELLEEQATLLRTKPYGSFKQSLSKAYHYPFKDELNKLSQLIDSLKILTQRADFNSVNAWAPLVIQLIAQVQFHLKQPSPSSRFKNKWVQQATTAVNHCSWDLCEEGLKALSQATSTDITFIKTAALKERQRLKLEDQLKTYINTNVPRLENLHSTPSFFGGRLVSPEALDATKELLRVCSNQLSLDSLSPEHINTLNRVNPLRAFMRRYEALAVVDFEGLSSTTSV